MSPNRKTPSSLGGAKTPWFGIFQQLSDESGGIMLEDASLLLPWLESALVEGVLGASPSWRNTSIEVWFTISAHGRTSTTTVLRIGSKFANPICRKKIQIYYFVSIHWNIGLSNKNITWLICHGARGNITCRSILGWSVQRVGRLEPVDR